MALNPTDEIRSAPTTKLGILRNIGPGMILAGSIVGSGELIATTRTGAEAGFDFLWLIILGCIIKVFTLIELGRHPISSGKTSLAALNGLTEVGGCLYISNNANLCQSIVDGFINLLITTGWYECGNSPYNDEDC